MEAGEKRELILQIVRHNWKHHCVTSGRTLLLTKHFLRDRTWPVFRHALTRAPSGFRSMGTCSAHWHSPWMMSGDAFEPVSVIAIAQRPGKSRSSFESRVVGQWRHGAMSNALWTGVRLHDLLEAAGIRVGAIDVSSLRVL